MIVDTGLNFNFMKKNYTICDRLKYMLGKGVSRWTFPFRLQEKSNEFHLVKLKSSLLSDDMIG